MHIILFQPQIPQNTGNVVRTCSVTGTSLSLVTPLGFKTDDRSLKRAGLDYWEGVNVNYIDDLELFLKSFAGSFTFFSSKATKHYTEVSYNPEHVLIFGSETTGLPASLTSQWPENTARIPMITDARCLNLATSVGIVLYEALRQNNFFTLH